MAGCGKEDNNGKIVTGDKLRCGTKLTFGTGKAPRVTTVHLCKECQAKEEGQ